MSESKKQLYTVAVMFYIAYITLMWKWGHQGDMGFWTNWSKHIFQEGLTNAYKDGSINYFPAYLYFIRFHIFIQGNLTDILDNLYTLKYYTLLFDVLGALLTVRFVRDETKKLYYFVLLMLNIAFFYNTALWGQVDAIFSFWGFSAIILALERRPVWSILFWVVALNFKLQAVVFLPVLGLLLLPQFTGRQWKRLIPAAAGAVAVQLLILSPFILKGTVGQVWRVLTSLVDFYPSPALGAFNIWFLLLPDVNLESMMNLSDQARFGAFTYKQWGLLMFAAAMLLSIWPYLKYLKFRYINRIAAEFPLEKVFLMTALVALSFYFFNTQMHERYAHPAMLPLAAYTFLTRRWWPFIIISIAYGLNLERICWYLHLHNETYMNAWFLSEKPIAVLYLAGILLMFYHLYTAERNDQKVSI